MFGINGNDKRVLHNSNKGGTLFPITGEQKENTCVIYIKYKLMV